MYVFFYQNIIYHSLTTPSFSIDNTDEIFDDFHCDDDYCECDYDDLIVFDVVLVVVVEDFVDDVLILELLLILNRNMLLIQCLGLCPLGEGRGPVEREKTNLI